MNRQPLRFSDVGIQVPSGAHGDVAVRCPRCEPERKKKNLKPLYVNVEKGTWKCFHCFRAGSLTRGWIDDPVEVEHSGPRRAYERPDPLPRSAPPTLWQNVVAYCAKRGISEPTLLAAGLSATQHYCKQCQAEGKSDEAVEILLFPYLKHGQHVNTKHRCPHKHFTMEWKAERVLYGYDDIVLADGTMPEYVIVVEGEFDKLALAEAGYQHVISVPDGAPKEGTRNFGQKLNVFDDDALQRILQGGCKKVILATDADGPGETLRDELISRFAPEHCFIVTWPPGIKDANDALREIGVDGLREIIEAAEPAPVEGLIDPEMLFAQTDRYYRDGLPRGVSTGWAALDPYIRLTQGGLMVIHAVPQSGKSTWVNALLMNLANLYGWKFGVFSPEWQPVALHQVAMIETIIGKPFEGVGRMSHDEKRHGETWLQQFGTYIAPEDKTPKTLIARGKTLKFRKGIAVLVIDPWTEIEHEYDERRQDKLTYIGRTLSELRAFGQKHNILVILVVHPTKPNKKVMVNGMAKYEPMGMYGAAHSADFTNKADFIIELERDVDCTRVHVEKVRLKWCGTQGVATLYFDRETGRFTDQPLFNELPEGIEG